MFTGGPIFGVVQDKLFPSRYNRAMVRNMINVADYIRDDFYKNNKTNIRKHMEELSIAYKKRMEIKGFYDGKKLMDDFLGFYINAKSDLIDRDIEFNDWNGGNVMVDGNNNWKLIDLGYSKSPGANIDILENWVRRIYGSN